MDVKKHLVMSHMKLIKDRTQYGHFADDVLSAPPLCPHRVQVVRLLPGWIAERVVKPANFGQCFVALRRFFAEMHTRPKAEK